MTWDPGTREERRKSLREYGEKFDRPVQHMLDLDDEFPSVDMFGPQSISAEVGPGWVELLRPALRALSLLGGKVGQIKQKFGGLRFYWDPPEEMRAKWQAWHDGGRQGQSPYELSPLYTQTSLAVHLAEELSWSTCELCGVDIGRRSGPTWRVRCKNCEDKR